MKEHDYGKNSFYLQLCECHTDMLALLLNFHLITDNGPEENSGFFPVIFFSILISSDPFHWCSMEAKRLL